MSGFNWFFKLFRRTKRVKLGFYGAPNVGKTSLANKIAGDWAGETVGIVSAVPHETRMVQTKENVLVQANGTDLKMNIMDMPGIATQIDYRDFLKHKISKKKAQLRAKEATEGIIEAIKQLDNVDVVLAVMDSTQDPYTQVNLTILGNLEARDIPVVIVANKTDLRKSNVDRIQEAFPQHKVVGVSAKTGENLEALYKTIAKAK